MKRSFWAWGYEEKFPDEETRRGMAAHAETLLGFGGLSPRPLPRLEDVTLRPSRVSPPAELRPFVTSEKTDRVMHTYGKSYKDIVRAFAGDFSPAPDLVAYPRNEADIAAVLAW